MSLLQIIECTKCGNTESIPFDRENLKMPWTVWPRGCPKCGCLRVDVTVIHDKIGRFKDAKIVPDERIRPMRRIELSK